MKFNTLFSQSSGRKNARRTFLLISWLVLANLAVAANTGNTKLATTVARPPAARLVSSSRQVAPKRVERYLEPARLVGAATVSLPLVVAATSDEQRAFDLINAERRKQGVPPLAWAGELVHLARLHSNDMADHGVLNHVGSDGRDASTRAAACGIRGWQALGENIAYNQGFDDPAAFAVERWMLSSKHRDNILNAGFTHAGLGVSRAADGRIFFTQVFMTR